MGGLDAAAAVTRLEEVYSLPLDLVIEDHTIAASPVDLGFEMDPFSLVQAALDEVQTGGYWSTLWNRISSEAVTVPLDATVNSETLRNYLVQEIEPRYTQASTPLSPIPNTTNFALSTTGNGLDLDQSVTDITAALLDPDIHQVLSQSPMLRPVRWTGPPWKSFSNTISNGPALTGW